MIRFPSPSERTGFFFTNGFSSLEALLGVTMLGLFGTAIMGALVYGLQGISVSGNYARATLLAEEGIEAIRNIRDEDFSNLVDGTHGLALSGGTWIFSGSSDTTDVFTRTTTISTISASEKEISSEVTWNGQNGRTGVITLLTRLTDWRLPDAPTIGNWSNPAQESTSNLSGNQDGIRLALQGSYVYLIRNGGNPDFIILNISNTASPSVIGSLNLAGNPRDITVIGNYAYIASNQNNAELQVISISNPASPSVVNTINLSGNQDGQSVAVDGNTLFLTRASSGNDEFLTYDISSPANPSFLGSEDLGNGDNRAMYINGSHAYIVSNQNNQELKIIDISNLSSPFFATAYDMTGNNDGNFVTGFGSTLLVGRSNGELAIFSISSPLSPVLLGTFDAQSAINGISLGNSGTYAFLATDENSAEFQVVDISNPASATLVGSLNLGGDIDGIVYDEGKDRAFVAGEDNAEEFSVFMPQ